MFIITSTLSNVQNLVSWEILTRSGTLAAILLLFLTSIALLLSDSTFWNKWASSTYEICAHPLMIVFAIVVLFKAISILQ